MLLGAISALDERANGPYVRIRAPVLPHEWICSSSVKSGWGREERPSAEIGMGEGGKA